MVRSAGLLADVPFASLELPGPLAAIGAGLALLGPAGGAAPGAVAWSPG